MRVAQPLQIDSGWHVFGLSAGSIVMFSVLTLVFPETASSILSAARSWIVVELDWLFMLAANATLLVCVIVAFSPLGKLRLGGAAAQPQFSAAAWLAMLFAAGVGTGMVFYGTAEPAAYYSGWSGTPLNVPAQTPAAERLAFSATMVHWGFTPWAIYALVGIGLGYAHYNQGLPMTIRSAFAPVLADATWRWPGHMIDFIAVIATVFGLATALGMGVTLVGSGIEFLTGISNGLAIQLPLIIAITGLAIGSVVRGLDRGIRVLSQINLALAFALLAFIILAGPTARITASYLPNMAAYMADFAALSSWGQRPDEPWFRNWTILYFAWWVAWSPFVGVFIARISKGRTIRSVLAATIILPTLIGLVWFSSFGGAAIAQIQDGIGALSEGVVPDHLVLYQTLNNLPWPQVTSLLAIVLLIVFFVTSSDSGSFVVDMITAGGRLDAPVARRVFWASLEGLVAIALLVGGGKTALSTLQSGVILAGLPFTLLLLFCGFSLLLSLVDALRRKRTLKAM